MPGIKHPELTETDQPPASSLADSETDIDERPLPNEIDDPSPLTPNEVDGTDLLAPLVPLSAEEVEELLDPPSTDEVKRQR